MFWVLTNPVNSDLIAILYDEEQVRNYVQDPFTRDPLVVEMCDEEGCILCAHTFHMPDIRILN